MSKKVHVNNSSDDFQMISPNQQNEQITYQIVEETNSYINDQKNIKKKFIVRLIYLLICIVASLLIDPLWHYPSKYRQFDQYFASSAHIINATVPLKTQYNPITWPELGKLQIVDLTVIFQTSGRTDMLNSTLRSFFKFNTYPLKKIVAVHDGVMNQNLQKIVETYPNITWIITNIKVGQLAAIDQAYKHIDTQYYFHTQDDWEYLRPGFIEYCIQALAFDPKLNGLHLTHKVANQSQFFIAGPLRIVTQLQLRWYSGFSFYPSAHRMKEYRSLPGGYVGASYNLSYAKGVGNCESFISIQFSARNYHYASSPLQFVDHTGAGKGSPSKFWSKSTHIGWIAKFTQYYVWYFFSSNRKSLQRQLKYLEQKQKL